MTSHRVSRLSRIELAVYLSGKGVSQQGVQSIKENGITGEMLVDFCEDDIRDAFSVFKDRFIVRKIIREAKASNPLSKFDPYPAMGKQTTEVKVTQGQPGPLLPTRDGGGFSKMASNSFPMVAQAPQRVGLTRAPGINSQTVSRVLQNIQTRPFPVSMHKAEGAFPVCSQTLGLTKSVDIKTESRVRSPTVSSTVEDSQKRQVQQQSSSSCEQWTIYNVNKIDFTQDSRKIEPLPNTGLNIRPSDSSNLHPLYTEPFSLDLIMIDEKTKPFSLDLTIDERNRIQKYTADQLLEKKEMRGRPNEAQHLGSLAIRNAAQAANIWNSAPLMRDISEQSMNKFKEYIKSFAPQMMEKMDVVIGRLRESLQNRRKYLLDRDSGKRATVQSRYRHSSTECRFGPQNTGDEAGGLNEKTIKTETKIKIEDAGSLIDLTE